MGSQAFTTLPNQDKFLNLLPENLFFPLIRPGTVKLRLPGCGEGEPKEDPGHDWNLTLPAQHNASLEKYHTGDAGDAGDAGDEGL